MGSKNLVRPNLFWDVPMFQKMLDSEGHGGSYLSSMAYTSVSCSKAEIVTDARKNYTRHTADLVARSDILKRKCCKTLQYLAYLRIFNILCRSKPHL